MSVCSKKIIAQTTCTMNAVLGEWKYISSFGKDINMDSLLRSVNPNIVPISLWTFKSDGTQTSKLFNKKSISKNKYLLDEKKCEIIFGSVEKANEETTYKILHLDSKFMILQRVNTKGGYQSYVLVR